MIENIAIAWAVTATVGAMVVERLCARELKSGTETLNDARRLLIAWQNHATGEEARCDYWRSVAIDLEDKLRTIEFKRHNSAKHARAAQLAQAKALRDAKTSELRRDLQASLAEADRMAA